MEASCAVWIFALITVCSGSLGAPNIGKQFVVPFFENNCIEPSENHIIVTGTRDNTKVTITGDKSNFKTEANVGAGESIRIPIPDEASTEPLVVLTSQNVAVMSSSYQCQGGDISFMFPTNQWGLLYYITTPDPGPQKGYKAFSVTTQALPAIVTTILTGTVRYKGRTYQKGSTMVESMGPFQTMELRSNGDLSGSRVAASAPVAVQVAITCGTGFTDCYQVSETLVPVEIMGRQYFIPSTSLRFNPLSIYVMARKKTRIQYTSSTGTNVKVVDAGELLTINMDNPSSLSLSSPDPFQVLLYGRGGTYNDTPISPFLSLIPGTDKFGLKFNPVSQGNFNNLAFVIAKTESTPGITFDGQHPEENEWKQFPGKEFSWTERNLGDTFESHTVGGSTNPFGMIIIGYGNNVSYATMGTPIIASPTSTT